VIPQFSVSLMCMDLMRAADQIQALNPLADAYHLDIMDGQFAPDLALSPAWVRAVAPLAHVPLEAHLMTERPAMWIEPLAEAGVQILSPHAETLGRDAFRVMEQIRSLGCSAGLVLNPMTPLSAVRHVLPRVDLLTLMTVDVGFAGQSLVPETLPKISEAARWREREGLGFRLQVDGACNEGTFARMRAAGADVFVLGSTGLFSLSDDLGCAWQLMEEAFERSTGEAVGGREPMEARVGEGALR